MLLCLQFLCWVLCTVIVCSFMPWNFLFDFGFDYPVCTFWHPFTKYDIHFSLTAAMLYFIIHKLELKWIMCVFPKYEVMTVFFSTMTYQTCNCYHSLPKEGSTLSVLIIFWYCTSKINFPIFFSIAPGIIEVKSYTKKKWINKWYQWNKIEIDAVIPEN